MPKLTVIEKSTGKKEVFEFGLEDVGIGRASENSVRLSSSGVSRRHASIVASGNSFFLVDLGSGGGTHLNGVQLKANEKNLLKHGDNIAIENFNLNFSQIDELLSSSFNDITDSDIIEVKLLKKVMRAIDKESVPSLEVLSGNFAGKKYFLADNVPEAVIGREEGCEFQVDEYVISRKHARIFRKEGKIFVQDLGSKNGLLLNNRQITADRELHDGDKLTLGTIAIIFRNPKEVKVGKISIKSQAPSPLGGEGGGEGEAGAGAEASQRREGLESPPDDAEAVIEPSEFDDYPAPAPRSELIKLSFFELGMIGFGILIFIFAVISFISLIG